MSDLEHGMGDPQAPFDDGMRAGLVERVAIEVEADKDRLLGAIIYDMIEGQHGAVVAREFRDAIIARTRPGTKARAQQDRCLALLTDRLNKLVENIP